MHLSLFAVCAKYNSIFHLVHTYMQIVKSPESFRAVATKLRVDVLRIDVNGKLTPAAKTPKRQNVNPYASRETEARAIFELLRGSHSEYFRDERANDGAYLDCVHVSVLTIKDAEQICDHLQDLFRTHSVPGSVIFAHAERVDDYQRYLCGGTDVRVCVCTSFASSGITAEYTSLVVSLNERSIDGIIQVMNRAGRVHHDSVCYVYIDSIAGYARGGMGKIGEQSMVRVQDKATNFFSSSSESVKAKASAFLGPLSIQRFLTTPYCHKMYLNAAIERQTFPDLQQGIACGSMCSFCSVHECSTLLPMAVVPVHPSIPVTYANSTESNFSVDTVPLEAYDDTLTEDAVYHSDAFYKLEDAATKTQCDIHASVVQWLKIITKKECYFCGTMPCDGNGVGCARGRDVMRSCSLCDLPIEKHASRAKFNNYRSCCQSNDLTCGTCFLEPKFAFTAFGMKPECHLQECRGLLGSSKSAPSVVPPHARLGGYQHLYRTDKARGFYLWIIRLVNMTAKTHEIFEVLAKGVLAEHLIHASKLLWIDTPVVASITDSQHLADTVFELVGVFAKFGVSQ